jgi:hypothetical protein
VEAIGATAFAAARLVITGNGRPWAKAYTAAQLETLPDPPNCMPDWLRKH